ncbi:PREDICTED: alkane hydroxylase MAH1-like [Ipomoea nil]|uniref:alkane hydroxylase MAH1-like n=1 Tax=Ipomoea nil TaxID=35883 RepID=UPI00090109AA|nr:PREDICTED: alkane hydroxylase MAH1-like [Ipomoea nil]
MRIFKESYDDVIVVAMLCCALCWVWAPQIWKKRSRRSVVPTNWPVVGMSPGFLQNAGRIHEYVTEILRQSGGTFEFKGPWFANMDMLITCDPANVNHILCRNFENYPKGPRFQKIFHVVGEGMINVDSELWELHRKTTPPLMNQANFRTSLERNVSQKMENGLIPVLDHYAQQGTHIDLQEIFQRMAFDISCQQFLDKDPGSLCVDPTDDHPFREAIRDAVNAILYRHILPERCWKLQKYYGIDREKKLTQADRTFDNFIYPILEERTEQLNNKTQQQPHDSSGMLTSHIETHRGKSMQFLRDTFVTLIIAGGDTTASALTWFFLLLAQNPQVEAKILHHILQLKQDKKVFKVEECQKLTYLHAAFCESLRLFPPLPLNHKTPMEKDILPSGHVVTPNTKIIMTFYSMGRMDTLWGEDCMEFKPERWISPDGGIKRQPSYKYPVFNAGPRICIGRDMAFTMVKMIAATIICHYQFQLVEPHHPQILVTDSILLEMKNGLKVKFSKRM